VAPNDKVQKEEFASADFPACTPLDVVTTIPTPMISASPEVTNVRGIVSQVDLRTVAVLSKKAVLGDIPAVLGTPQPAYIVTDSEVTILVFARDEVREGLEHRPELMESKSDPRYYVVIRLSYGTRLRSLITRRGAHWLASACRLVSFCVFPLDSLLWGGVLQFSGGRPSRSCR
jgi:hypothetical protein